MKVLETSVITIWSTHRNPSVEVSELFKKTRSQLLKNTHRYTVRGKIRSVYVTIWFLPFRDEVLNFNNPSVCWHSILQSSSLDNTSMFHFVLPLPPSLSLTPIRPTLRKIVLYSRLVSRLTYTSSGRLFTSLSLCPSPLMFVFPTLRPRSNLEISFKFYRSHLLTLPTLSLSPSVIQPLGPSGLVHPGRIDTFLKLVPWLH